MNFRTAGAKLLNSAIRNECSELVCFRLEDDKPLDFVRSKGMDPDQVKALQPLHFISRNLDSRGELRGAIQI